MAKKSSSNKNVVREDLANCGTVPKVITEQPAKIRYLTECKWGYSTSDESITYYGRDLDLNVLCWAEGDEIQGDKYVACSFWAR